MKLKWRNQNTIRVNTYKEGRYPMGIYAAFL